MNEIGLHVAECITEECLQGGREGCRRMQWRGGRGGEEVRGTGAPVYMLEYLIGVVALREWGANVSLNDYELLACWSE